MKQSIANALSEVRASVREARALATLIEQVTPDANPVSDAAAAIQSVLAGANESLDDMEDELSKPNLTIVR